jgi:serine/threonine protein kinase
MSLSAGTRLGPYEILAPIGAGGMGEVYKARDTRLDRTVAIKVLPEHRSASPQARERFEREAKAISSLSHPHICPLYDIGNQDGTDYLVMEYLEGQTLASRLKKTPLPADQVLQYAIQITDALDTAHKHGVIHRDLKPGNVMLTKTGREAAGFWIGKDAYRRSRCGRDRAAHRNHTPHQRRNNLGNPAVHGARATRRQRSRRVNRHLRAGCRALRNGHRAEGV